MLLAMSSSCVDTACAMETMHDKQDIPQSLDVILGRGKRYSKNPGNMIFQGLVQTNRLRYLESSFAVKREIIAEVMCIIKKQGGRFVQEKDGVWSVVPDTTSRLKIAHAIQYHIRTEFSQSKDVSEEDGTSMEQVPWEKLSEHGRVVRSIRQKIFKLQNQPSASQLPRLYHDTVHQLPISISNAQASNVVVEGLRMHKVEIPSEPIFVQCPVSPHVQNAEEQHLSEFDQFMYGRHLNTFSFQHHQLPFERPVVHNHIEWTKNEPLPYTTTFVHPIRSSRGM